MCQLTNILQRGLGEIAEEDLPTASIIVIDEAHLQRGLGEIAEEDQRGQPATGAHVDPFNEASARSPRKTMKRG